MLILSCNGVRLLDVNTEEEAFFEMRRYLEVNQIKSNSTTTFVRERRENGAVKYKQVEMNFGSRISATFRIYYQCENPDNEFTALEKYQEDLATNECFFMFFAYKNKEKMNWMRNYFDDLAERKGGGV